MKEIKVNELTDNLFETISKEWKMCIRDRHKLLTINNVTLLKIT